jgi:hypothetical protein
VLGQAGEDCRLAGCRDRDTKNEQARFNTCLQDFSAKAAAILQVAGTVSQKVPTLFKVMHNEDPAYAELEGLAQKLTTSLAQIVPIAFKLGLADFAAFGRLIDDMVSLLAATDRLTTPPLVLLNFRGHFEPFVEQSVNAHVEITPKIQGLLEAVVRLIPMGQPAVQKLAQDRLLALFGALQQAHAAWPATLKACLAAMQKDRRFVVFGGRAVGGWSSVASALVPGAQAVSKLALALFNQQPYDMAGTEIAINQGLSALTQAMGGVVQWDPKAELFRFREAIEYGFKDVKETTVAPVAFYLLCVFGYYEPHPGIGAAIKAVLPCVQKALEQATASPKGPGWVLPILLGFGVSAAFRTYTGVLIEASKVLIGQLEDMATVAEKSLYAKVKQLAGAVSAKITECKDVLGASPPAEHDPLWTKRLVDALQAIAPPYMEFIKAAQGLPLRQVPDFVTMFQQVNDTFVDIVDLLPLVRAIDVNLSSGQAGQMLESTIADLEEVAGGTQKALPTLHPGAGRRLLTALYGFIRTMDIRPELQPQAKVFRDLAGGIGYDTSMIAIGGFNDTGPVNSALQQILAFLASAKPLRDRLLQQGGIAAGAAGASSASTKRSELAKNAAIAQLRQGGDVAKKIADRIAALPHPGPVTAGDFAAAVDEFRRLPTSQAKLDAVPELFVKALAYTESLDPAVQAGVQKALGDAIALIKTDPIAGVAAFEAACSALAAGGQAAGAGQPGTVGAAAATTPAVRAAYDEAVAAVKSGTPAEGAAACERFLWADRVAKALAGQPDPLADQTSLQSKLKQQVGAKQFNKAAVSGTLGELGAALFQLEAMGEAIDSLSAGCASSQQIADRLAGASPISPVTQSQLGAALAAFKALPGRASQIAALPELFQKGLAYAASLEDPARTELKKALLGAMDLAKTDPAAAVAALQTVLDVACSAAPGAAGAAAAKAAVRSAYDAAVAAAPAGSPADVATTCDRLLWADAAAKALAGQPDPRGQAGSLQAKLKAQANASPLNRPELKQTLQGLGTDLFGLQFAVSAEDLAKSVEAFRALSPKGKADGLPALIAKAKAYASTLGDPAKTLLLKAIADAEALAKTDPAAAAAALEAILGVVGPSGVAGPQGSQAAADAAEAAVGAAYDEAMRALKTGTEAEAAAAVNRFLWADRAARSLAGKPDALADPKSLQAQIKAKVGGKPFPRPALVDLMTRVGRELFQSVPPAVSGDDVGEAALDLQSQFLALAKSGSLARAKAKACTAAALCCGAAAKVSLPAAWQKQLQFNVDELLDSLRALDAAKTPAETKKATRQCDSALSGLRRIADGVEGQGPVQAGDFVSTYAGLCAGLFEGRDTTPAVGKFKKEISGVKDVSAQLGALDGAVAGGDNLGAARAATTAVGLALTEKTAAPAAKIDWSSFSDLPKRFAHTASAPQAGAPLAELLQKVKTAAAATKAHGPAFGKSVTSGASVKSSIEDAHVNLGGLLDAIEALKAGVWSPGALSSLGNAASSVVDLGDQTCSAGTLRMFNADGWQHAVDDTVGKFSTVVDSVVAEAEKAVAAAAADLKPLSGAERELQRAGQEVALAMRKMQQLSGVAAINKDKFGEGFFGTELLQIASPIFASSNQLIEAAKQQTAFLLKRDPNMQFTAGLVKTARDVVDSLSAVYLASEAVVEGEKGAMAKVISAGSLISRAVAAFTAEVNQKQGSYELTATMGTITKSIQEMCNHLKTFGESALNLEAEAAAAAAGPQVSESIRSQLNAEAAVVTARKTLEMAEAEARRIKAALTSKRKD